MEFLLKRAAKLKLMMMSLVHDDGQVAQEGCANFFQTMTHTGGKERNNPNVEILNNIVSFMRALQNIKCYYSPRHLNSNS